MKKIQIIFIIILTVINVANAQDTLNAKQSMTLKEIQEYAINNNYQVRNSELDIKIAKNKKWETTAIGLPQISGTVEYQNFPDIPTQLMPNFITPAVVGVNTSLFGLVPIAPIPEDDKFPVQFGSKHNASWGINVSQLIFSGEYIVGLKASKIYMELSEQNNEKTKSDIKESVTKTFYLILISEESLNILDSVYNSLDGLLNESEKLQESGFIESTDVEQLRLNLKNTENSIISFKNQKEILYKLLKFQSGIDYMQDISIVGNLDSISSGISTLEILSADFDINSNPSYKLMTVQENLMKLNYDREKTTALPSVAAYYSYNKKAMRDSFDIFSEQAEWYPTGVWGIKINVPIFSSGMRYSKTIQRKLEYDKTSNQLLQMEQSLHLDVDQTRSNYITSLNKLKNQKDTRDLSEKIYQNTLVKYKTGTESSLALTQAQNQYFIALSEYYRQLGELIDVRIKLLNLLNLL